MFTREFMLSTLEWVGTAAIGALVSAYLTGGIHGWGDVWAVAAGAAGTALLKVLAASRTGQGTPALVEPPVVVREVPIPAPVAAPRRPVERGPQL